MRRKIEKEHPNTPYMQSKDPKQSWEDRVATEIIRILLTCSRPKIDNKYGKTRLQLADESRKPLTTIQGPVIHRF